VPHAWPKASSQKGVMQAHPSWVILASCCFPIALFN
jgi:hypothetical protein